MTSPGTPGRARVPSLKVRALQWLAQREHSRAELRRRLLRLAASPAQPASGPDPSADGAAGAAGAAGADDAEARVDELLDWLEAHRYLSEARFAESRVHARAGRFGNLRIRQELAQHRVVLTPDAEQSLKETELARAREVWRRRYAAPAQSAAERARQARFLTGRGFSAEIVRRVLREGGAAPDDETTD